MTNEQEVANKGMGEGIGSEGQIKIVTSLIKL